MSWLVLVLISTVLYCINIFVDKSLLAYQIIEKAILEDNNYGSSNIGEGKNVTLDYSSPNIAKSFSIGHLRSTMIGNSLKLILKKCGYNTYSINHIVFCLYHNGVCFWNIDNSST